jgi:hypothetical protein
MIEDETIHQREGYMLILDPVIGLMRLCMTGITAWVVLEVLSTGHGRDFVQQLPTLIKTYKTLAKLVNNPLKPAGTWPICMLQLRLGGLGRPESLYQVACL